MAVTDLTTAYAALSLSLACAERREVVVEEETLVAALEHVVNELLVHLCAERTGREALCLATGEDGASVRHGQRRNLAPDRTDLVGLAAIETNALVEDATAHGVTHNVVIVALHLCMLLLQVVLAEVGVCGIVCLLEVGKNLVESLLACLLLKSLLCHVVSLGIKLGVHLLAQVLVVHLMAILALNVGAKLL